MTVANFGSDDVAWILVDGYSLGAVLGEFTPDGPEAMIEQNHGYGVSWVANAPVGLSQFGLAYTGWVDDDGNTLADALINQNGNTRVVNFAMEGGAIGDPFDGFVAPLQTKNTRQVQRGQLTKIALQMAGSGNYEEADGSRDGILHDLSAETAAGDTSASPIDSGNAAGSSGGASGYVQVTALTLDGYDSITIRILDSTDDISYAELIAFTAVTAAPAAERLTATGTVNRYLDCDWTFDGTGTAPTCTFMVGAVRLGPDI